MNKTELAVRDLVRLLLEQHGLDIVEDPQYDGEERYTGTEFYIIRVGQKDAEDCYLNLREITA